MTIDEVEIEEQHLVQTPLVKLVAILGVPPVLDALTTKVNEVQESTSDSVKEVLSSEEQSMNLTSVGIKVQSPTMMTTGVKSMPDVSTHVDTESDPTLSSFDTDIDSDYSTSSALSKVCTCLPCLNAKLISRCLGGL